jgi:hypothetical protein
VKTHLNLMPAEDRRRLILVRRIRLWLPVWGVTVLASLSVSHFLYRSRLMLEREVIAMERQAAPLRQMRAATDVMLSEREYLSRNSVLPPELQNPPSAFAVLAAVSVAAQETENDLFVRELTASSAPVVWTSAAADSTAATDASGASDVARAPVPTVRLSLEGEATGDLSIARFVQSLQELLDDVELTSTAQSERSAATARAFTLTGAMLSGDAP